mmetsp:Transcript_8107/g.17212  ORF Transcript_8107/g.17212 Transcript_8107/m.17212 type:complete len:275 (+) Transcript_8107:356-1180(+)
MEAKSTAPVKCCGKRATMESHAVDPPVNLALATSKVALLPWCTIASGMIGVSGAPARSHAVEVSARGTARSRCRPATGVKRANPGVLWKLPLATWRSVMAGRRRSVGGLIGWSGDRVRPRAVVDSLSVSASWSGFQSTEIGVGASALRNSDWSTPCWGLSDRHRRGCGARRPRTSRTGPWFGGPRRGDWALLAWAVAGGWRGSCCKSLAPGRRRSCSRVGISRVMLTNRRTYGSRTASLGNGRIGLLAIAPVYGTETGPSTRQLATGAPRAWGR